MWLIIAAIAVVALLFRGQTTQPVIAGTSQNQGGPWPLGFLTWRNGITSTPGVFGQQTGAPQAVNAYAPSQVTPMDKKNPYKFN